MTGAPPSDGGRQAVSWPQEVLLLAERMRPGTTLAPGCVVHRGHLFTTSPDLDALARTVELLGRRHEAVWTLPVTAATGGPATEETSPVPGATHLTVRDLPLTDDDPRVTAAVTAVAHEPFDLCAGPLMRATWMRLRSGGVLVLALHHWAGDAGALDALADDLAALYGAAVRGEQPPRDPPSYSQVVGRQRRPSPPEVAEAAGWWRQELAGARRASIPVGADARPSGAMALLSQRMNDEAHHALIELAVGCRASPYMVFLAAFGALLDTGSAGSTTDALVFAVHARRAGQARRVVGFLAEPLPLRLRLDRDAPLSAAVESVRATVLGALSRSEAPFLRLLEASPRLAVGLMRGRRPGTLVQYVESRPLQLGEHHGSPLPLYGAHADGDTYPSVLPIDLDVTLERRGEEHRISVLHDTGLWRTEEVADIVSAAQRMLVDGAAGDAPLGRLRTAGRP